MTLLAALAAIPAALASPDSVVVFSELHYNPDEASESGEWVELHNQMAIHIDLSGWNLEGGIDYTFPSGTLIAPGGYLVIASDPSHPSLSGIPDVLGPYSGRLSNGGESIRLVTPADRLMDELRYDDEDPWPIEADGFGATLAKADPDSASEPPENWTKSAQIGGTPGLRNFPEAGSIIRHDLVASDAAWKFTAPGSAPPASWTAPGFDDSSWSDGTAIFGSEGTSGGATLTVTEDLVERYRAGTISGTPDGGTPSAWNDSATSDGAAQNAAPGGNPTFRTGVTPSGEAAVRFDGNDEFRTSAPPGIPGSSGFVYFIVAKARVAPTSGGISDGNGAYIFDRVAVTGNPLASLKAVGGRYGFQVRYDNGSGLGGPISATSISTSDFQIVAVRRNPVLSRFEIWVDGVMEATSSDSGVSLTPDPIVIGRHATIASGGFDGDIAEVLVYRDSLSDTEFDAAGSYLENAYGLDTAFGGSTVQTTLPESDGAAYFRNEFTFTGDPSAATLRLSATVADGAVIYLNGAEVHRVNMPAGAVTHDTAALADAADPIAAGPIELPIDALASGPNVLAISLHRGAGSSDRLFGAVLEASEIPPDPSRAAPLEFSEIAGSSEQTFFVELVNATDSSVDTGGMRIEASGSLSAGFDLPPAAIEPGGRTSFTESELGFRPAAGDKLAIFTAGRTAVADARLVDTRGRGRRAPDEWFFTASATPGGENVFDLEDRIVISEICYNATPLMPTEGIPPTFESVPLAAMDSAWRFNESGVDLGPAWASMRHDVGGDWESGPGIFAFESEPLPAPVGTQLAFPGLNNPYVVTYYFETDFTLAEADAAALASLQLTHLIDDGAIFYLNGVEIHRHNMPAGAVSASTLASTNSDASLIGPVSIPVPQGAAVAGVNRFSVEVHQGSGNSGDVVFGAEFTGDFITDPGSPPLPYRSSEEQWIELHNRGAAPVDLTGWRFGDGFDYSFPDGFSMQPGARAVVARDPSALGQLHPGITILGPFEDGSLSRGGERVTLLDATGNPADTVRYFDGGRWPERADAGGSTLELRDSDADNAIPEAWSASDESSRTSWTTISYRGVASPSSVGPDGQWRDFVFGLLEEGEMLIDDISVRENPDGAAVQMISNGDFEAGSSGWRMLGNHGHSRVIPDPDQPGNEVLHLVATGSTEHMHNHIETTLAGGRQVVNGRTYEISFRARWIGGCHQIHTRLYFNRLARKSAVPRPDRIGTPGAANSTAVANAGPTFREFVHFPAVPAAGESVTVRAEAADPDGVASVTLQYSVNGGGFSSIPMTPAGPNGFTASIPGAAAGNVVQFYAEATDALGATSFFPRRGPDSRAMYQVEDGRAATTGLHNFRIVMTPQDRDFMHTPIHVMSNGRMGATVIYNERDIFYDVGVRIKGSERARLQPSRVGFNVAFDEDQLFRGIHRTVAIDRSEGQVVGQIEQLWDQMMIASGGIPAEFNDLIRVISPKPEHTSSAQLQLARFGDVFLDSQFESGSDGTVFEYELIYYPLTADAQGYKIPEPDSVVGVSIGDLGNDPESYRWPYLIKNNQEKDDYSGIMEMAKHFSTSGAAFENELEDVIDVDQWLRALAYSCATGAGDSFFANSRHNGQFYAAPDGRVLYFPHDLDFSFSASRPIFENAQLQKITSDPSRRRQYLGHLHDICTTVFNAAYMEPWTQRFGALLPEQNFAAHLGYITTRSNFILGQINSSIPQVAFQITTNGGSGFATDSSPVTLAGDGWVNIRSIRLAGSEVPLHAVWTDANSWEVYVPLGPGPNTITLEAIGFSGEVVGTDSITITNTGAGSLPSRDSLAVSKIYFNPPGGDEEGEYVEIMNISGANLDLTGAGFTSGISFTFAPGTTVAPGSRLLIVKNPDAFLAAFGPGLPVAGGFTGQLDNGGEQITLTGADGTVIRSFVYDDAPPWPTAADGDGYALALVSPSSNPDHSRPENWRASVTHGGSPGSSEDESYSAWNSRHGNPPDESDNDGDGLSARLEYFTGGDPNAPDPLARPQLELTSLPNGNIQLRLVVRRSAAAESATITADVSPDLDSWTEAANLILLSNTRLPSAPAVDELTFTADVDPAASPPTQFWRCVFGR